MDLTQLAESQDTRLRRYLNWCNVPTQDVDDVVQETWRIACSRDDTLDVDWGFLRNCANQARADNLRRAESMMIDYPSLSLDMEFESIAGDIVTLHESIPGGAAAEDVVLQSETIHTLVDAVVTCKKAPKTRVARYQWVRRVAQQIHRVDPDLELQLICGQCKVCLEPLHENLDGLALLHECRVIAKSEIVATATEEQVQNKWKAGRTCAGDGCTTPVKRGRLYCDIHRAATYNGRKQTRVVNGKTIVATNRQKHLCSWCGIKWARAYRTYCSRACSSAALSARSLQ